MVHIHVLRYTESFAMTAPGVRASTSCPESCVDSERDSAIVSVGAEGRMAGGKSFLKHYDRVFYQNVDTSSNHQREANLDILGLESQFFYPDTWS